MINVGRCLENIDTSNCIVKDDVNKSGEEDETMMFFSGF